MLKNDWSSHDHALRWIEHFNSYTWPIVDGKAAPIDAVPPRLLILDGHQTHQSLEFIEFAQRVNIVLLRFPAHTTHFLQPLDVSMFSQLKDAYKGELDTLCRRGVDVIEKENFLEIYSRIRDLVFAPTAQIHSFASTGIIPFDENSGLKRTAPPQEAH